jgi:hypothetical protein
VTRNNEVDEWLPILRPPYSDARYRHERFRADAYELSGREAITLGLCGSELRIGDIDAHALDVWERTWTGIHSSGAGKWNWRGLVEQLPRRAAVLRIAIWYGDDLCAMALGQASRRRVFGARHTVTLTFVERRPEPPSVPLRGQVIAIAATVARSYGVLLGARRLRLRAPDRNLLPYYRRYGFEPVWKGRTPLYCEKEIWA